MVPREEPRASKRIPKTRPQVETAQALFATLFGGAGTVDHRY